MLRTGPISRVVHGIYEYLAALVCLALPFIMNFSHDSATYTCVALGVVLLLVAALSDGATSLAGVLPAAVHALIDILIALAAFVMPFLLHVSSNRTETFTFFAFGVVHLLVSIATRYLPPPAPSHDRASRGPRHPVGALAEGTSVDLEAGRHTVLDDE